MSEQAIAFLVAVAAGFSIGFFYDAFRVIRLAFPHSSLVVQIEDVLYWLCTPFYFFYVLLRVGYGDVRFFSFLGAFLGVLLYFLTLSRLVMKISAFIIRVIKAVLKIIIFPFVWISKIIFKFFKLIKKMLKKLVNFVKKPLRLLRFYVMLKMREYLFELRVIFRKI